MRGSSDRLCNGVTMAQFVERLTSTLDLCAFIGSQSHLADDNLLFIGARIFCQYCVVNEERYNIDCNYRMIKFKIYSAVSVSFTVGTNEAYIFTYVSYGQIFASEL